MLIFLQLLDQGAFNANNYRRTRGMIAAIAAQDYAHARPPARGTGTRVLVTLPCYNEEAALPEVIRRMQDVARAENPYGVEIDFCFVDDGSSDQSVAVLRQRCPASFVSHKANVGGGGVLMTGFNIQRSLGYDYVVQCDGDGQHPIEAIPAFVAHARQGRYDLLVGSRFARVVDPAIGAVARGDNSQSTTWVRRTGAFVIRSVLLLFGRRARLTDPTSGFRAYSRKAGELLLRSMPDDYPEPESIVLAKVHGLALGEVLVPMTARATGKSTISSFKALVYMIKVCSALLGLRLRSLIA
jgi:glycosyltransferase involved in cell wall biosynthesis